MEKLNKEKLIITCLILPYFLFIFYSLSPAYASSDIRVGAYYYVWYIGKKNENITDSPIIGWENYWSNDSNLIKKHLTWFEQLDLDFIIISWWWNPGVGPKQFEDNATKAVFETVKNESSNLEIAIMVESENQTATFNYTRIYNYIYDNYVSKYPENYMKLYGKPLLCFYNGETLTKNGNIPLDDRFEIRIVGHQYYVHWIYNSFPGWHREEQELCMDGEINVMPRFDKRTFGENRTVDISLTEGFYDQQWQTVLNYAKKGQVKIVTITSWNEYAERTQIEPAFDNATVSPNSPQTTNPFYLYNKTRDYIKQLRNTIPETIPPEILIIIIIIIIIIAAASALAKLIASRT